MHNLKQLNRQITNKYQVDKLDDSDTSSTDKAQPVGKRSEESKRKRPQVGNQLSILEEDDKSFVSSHRLSTPSQKSVSSKGAGELSQEDL